MNDEQLLRLLAELPPEEWSPEQMVALRRRLPHAAELRAALGEHLALEQVFTHALTRRRITAADIRGRAAEQEAARRRRRLVIAAIVLLPLLTGLFAIGRSGRFGAADQQVARQDPELPTAQEDLPGESALSGQPHSPTSAPGAPAAGSSSGSAANQGIGGHTAAASNPTNDLADDPANNSAPASPPQRDPNDPVADPSEPAPVETLPWQSLADVTPRPIAQAMFDEFDATQLRVNPALLARWWQPIRGQLVPGRHRDMREISAVAYNGVYRLAAPWQPNSALRMLLLEAPQTQLDFWSGRQGVRVFVDTRDASLCAYRVEREAVSQTDTAPETDTAPPDQAPPPSAQPLELLATDNNRLRRTGIGPLEWRWQDGQLLATRGDVLLLAAPLSGMPDEVLLSGRGQLGGMSQVASEPWPWQPVAHPTVPLPTEWAWQMIPSADELAEAAGMQRRAALSMQSQAATPDKASGPAGVVSTLPEMIHHEDGSVELRATDLTEPLQALVYWQPQLPSELVMLVEGTPGTGVTLANAQNEPQNWLAFFAEQHSAEQCSDSEKNATGQSDAQAETDQAGTARASEDQSPLQVLGHAKFDERSFVRRPALDKHPASLVRGATWVRLVYASGYLRCWLSRDGRSWSESLPPVGLVVQATKVGIFIAPGKEERRVRLRQVYTRSLPGLELFCRPEVLGRGNASLRSTEMAPWLRSVCQTQPSEFSPVEWRRACALRALAQGVRGALAFQLVLALCDDLQDLAIDDAQRLAALDSLVTLADSSSVLNATRLAAQYETLGLELYRAGQLHPYQLVRRAYQQSPLWIKTRIEPLSETLVRCEMLRLIALGRWEALGELCRQIDYFSGLRYGARQSNEQLRAHRLADWAYTQVRQNSAWNQPYHDLEGTYSLAAIAGSWLHPLSEHLGRDSYNAMVELDAAVMGKAWDEASRLVANLPWQSTSGLLPVGSDANLQLALPVAVERVIRRHDELRSAMREHQTSAGLLALQQALSDSDAATMRALATQFYGTTAAIEAHRWLGDRALAAGDSLVAMAHYGQALEQRGENRTTDDALLENLRSRLRLAAAMLGYDEGAPVTDSVDLGEARLSPAEFEALATQLRNRAPQYLPEIEKSAYMPAPSRLSVASWAEWDGEMGRLTRNPPTGYMTANLDWAGCQLAATLTSQELLVSNRHQIKAYDRRDGKVLWTVSEPDSASAHDYSMVRMQPVVGEGRVVARMLGSGWPRLVSLDQVSGERRWTTPAGLRIASDPVLVPGKVLVVAAQPLQQQLVELQLLSIDAESGVLLQVQALAQVRDVWRGAIQCQLAAQGEQLLVVGCGVAIGCSLGEPPSWLRRQTWLPRAADVRVLPQRSLPPVIDDGRAYYAQHGVPDVQCVELRSGSLLWSQSVPEMVGVLGLSGGRLLVRTAHGIEAYDAEDGTLVWQRALSNLLEAHALDATQLLVAVAEPVPSRTRRPSLIWISSHDGRDQVRVPLTTLRGERIGLGPLVADEQGIWTFFAPHIEQAERQIIRLTSGEPAEPYTPRSWPVAWLSHLTSALSPPRDQMIGFALLGNESDSRNGQQPPDEQGRESLVTSARGGWDSYWARYLPAASAPRRLSVEVAAVAQPWTLQVELGEQVVARHIIESTEWQTLHIDLPTDYTEPCWLLVGHREHGQLGSRARWRRIAVEPVQAEDSSPATQVEPPHSHKP